MTRWWVKAVCMVGLVGVAVGGSLNASQAKEPTCAPEGTALTISAKDSKFSKDCLVSPKDTPFTITFENQDTVLHNVAIYDMADGKKKTIFKGEVFVGPRTVTYDVPAVPEGYYTFVCDPHDDKMIGTFISGAPAPTTSTSTTKPPPPTTSTTLLPKLPV